MAAEEIEELNSFTIRFTQSGGSFVMWFLGCWLLLGAASSAQQPTEPEPKPDTVCCRVDPFFVDRVWARVGERTCLKCHNSDGDAAETEFQLRSTLRDRTQLSHNLESFYRMARVKDEAGRSRILLKATGQLDHGGGEVLKAGSLDRQILEQFVRRALAASADTPHKLSKGDWAALEPAPFYAGVIFASDQRLLRRVTLSLCGRLPTERERQAVRKDGRKALDPLLDAMFEEDAFYERLKEGFNDIFLTAGYEGGEDLLSYDHFRNRLWYQKYDLSDIAEKDRQRTRWKLADVYREALRREPMELVEYIVRNDRPLTELVTADYMLVSPYTARGYGLFEEIQDQFADPDDPFEYQPARLNALVSRNGKVQESKTGLYPHAGLLSLFHYLKRYPTTDTNRNRLRARMVYQHFLGVDVMALAPRVSDAAALTSNFEIPTMQATDCVVCHRSVDPVAGLFQDFNDKGHLEPRREGWYEDMFAPGWDGEDLPEEDRWRALPWLGERVARDPRFPIAMSEHIYYLMMGRRVMAPPMDIEDPLFISKRRGYREQRRVVAEVAEVLVESGFNFKAALKAFIGSDLYRVDGLATAASDPEREAELEDVGLVRLLTPEQLERKITAVFGKPWGRLTHRESKFKILYGGIDSKSVTERMTEPSGAMGAIQRIMANDVACQNVAADFAKPAQERFLFPHVKTSDTPAEGEEAIARIRANIRHLHKRLLGRDVADDDRDAIRTYELFADIVADASERQFDKRGSYFCERVEEKYINDPVYAVRAWRGVVTYLLRQHEFLYE